MRANLRYLVLALLAGLLPGGRSVAETGVLIPWSVSTKPDPDVLAMRSMDVRVVIEDLHAEVRIDQVFENRTGNPLEGKYVLPLGAEASLTDFSLWEGDSRRIGAIVDKQRGRKLYEEITRQNIDPGLMETGDEEEAGVFSLRVSPIPAYGTTRITLTYEQELELGSLATQWTLPLKPRRYGAQSVGDFSLSIEVRGGAKIAEARLAPAAWFAKQQPAVGGSTGGTGFKLVYKGKDVNLAEDVQVGWRIEPPAGGVAGRLYAYRDTRPRKDRSPFGGATYVDETGFFLARGVFASASAADPKAKPDKPRDVVVLLDTSLSMQWDKMDVALAALGSFLGERLQPEDRFDVIVFHDEVRPLSATLMPANAANVDKALAFVRQSYLAGGTDLGGALAKAGEILQAAPRDGADRDVLLITDGHPTWGEIDLKKMTAAAKAALGKGRLFVLGIGDDVNGTLLRTLAAAVDGAYAVAPEGGDATFILATFFDKLGRPVYRDVKITLPDAAEITQVYPAHAAAFDGSAVAFFGRYAKPQPKGEGTIAGVVDDGTAGGGPVSARFAAPLGEKETEREYVARGWAARRIEDLLDRIRTEGEKDEWIGEIVALSKRFHVITPYTSFIAAPRALLRPRNFQAGDPILRVKTGPDIVGVTAIFPFGLTKALVYVEEEDIWETRFLAPVTMTDGNYECTLVLTDTAGRHVRESKSFTVDSRPPEVTVEPSAGAVRAGGRLLLTAHADADTRTLRARLGNGPAADLRWSREAKASVGEIVIPADLAPGVHEIHVVAEDFAHNTSMSKISITVLGN